MFVKIVVVITVRETTFNINGVRGKKNENKRKNRKYDRPWGVGLP